MIQRSKQQALMFLLGAVLVGGVVGFSADRVLRNQRFVSEYGPRARFYDAIDATDVQRNVLDSLGSEYDCAVKALLRPMKPQLDSMRARFNAQTESLYTPDQRAKVDARKKDLDARRKAATAKEPKRTCTK